MLERLLSYGRDAKKSQLRSALYYKDTAGNMDSIDFETDDEINEGLANRHNLV